MTDFSYVDGAGRCAPRSRWVQIQSRFKLMPAYTVIGFVVVLVLFETLAFAVAVNRGALFVEAFSKDYIVVAVDSRSINLIDRSGPGNDEYCKIQPLSDRAVFFSTGFAHVTENNVTVLDAGQIARSVYAAADSPADLRVLAARWGEQISPLYRQLSDRHPNVFAELPNDVVVDGFFVGFDGDDNVAVAETVIRHAAQSGLSTKNIYKKQQGDTATMNFGGYYDLIMEFADGGQTARAKTVLAEIDKDKAGASPAETAAIQASAFVKAVRDWSGDPTVGGEIASGIIERGQKWRWLHRPDFCPES